jgi:hypothetical protein
MSFSAPLKHNPDSDEALPHGRYYQRAAATTLELRPEEAGGPVFELFGPRMIRPLCESDATRAFLIVLERLNLFASKSAS